MCNRLAAAVMAVFLLVGGSMSAHAAPEPKDIILRYYEALRDVMERSDELGFEGRYGRLEPVIEETFNLAFMAEFTTGRYWKDFDETQRQAVIEGMKSLSTATYAARFDKYSGEKFDVLEERTTDRGDLIVLTHIVDSKGDPVGINYLMRRNEEEWGIIDVYLKGTISELATRRSEFTSVLRSQGHEGLIAAIDKLVNNLKSEG